MFLLKLRDGSHLSKDELWPVLSDASEGGENVGGSIAQGHDRHSSNVLGQPGHLHQHQHCLPIFTKGIKIYLGLKTDTSIHISSIIT